MVCLVTDKESVVEQHQLDRKAEDAASIATAKAMQILGREVGQTWVDKGLGERGSGWIKQQVRTKEGEWF